jgi:trimeric autotransporter adhesin
LGGTEAGNYNLVPTTTTTTAAISKANITAVTGATALDKVYNANTAATANLSAAALAGNLDGANLTVSSTGATFDNKNVGTGKTVTLAGLSLGGTEAGNYNLVPTTTTTTAAISKANITAVTGITAANKVFDGTNVTTANVGSAVLVGNLDGANVGVTAAAAVFDTPAVGTAKAVSITGLALSGSAASNYQLTAPTTAATTATITAAPVVSTTTPALEAQATVTAGVFNGAGATGGSGSGSGSGASGAGGAPGDTSGAATGGRGNFASLQAPRVDIQDLGVRIQLEVAKVCFERIASNGEISTVCQ